MGCFGESVASGRFGTPYAHAVIIFETAAEAAIPHTPSSPCVSLAVRGFLPAHPSSHAQPAASAVQQPCSCSAGRPLTVFTFYYRPTAQRPSHGAVPCRADTTGRDACLCTSAVVPVRAMQRSGGLAEGPTDRRTGRVVWASRAARRGRRYVRLAEPIRRFLSLRCFVLYH